MVVSWKLNYWQVLGQVTLIIYQGFDWSGLLDRSLSPPLLPSVNNTSDASNFDQFPRDTTVPTDENSGWDKDF